MKKERKVKLDKRELILEASTEIFAKNGFHRSTIREIANLAEMAVGTIYIYFKSKEEILQALLKKEMEKYFEHFSEKSRNLPAEEFFKAFYLERFNSISKDFQIMSIFMHEAMANPKLSDMFYKKLLKGILNYVKQFLSEKIDAKAFRNLDVDAVATIMISITVNLVMWKEGLFPKQLKGLSYKRLAETISEIFLNGLLNKDVKVKAAPAKSKAKK